MKDDIPNVCFATDKASVMRKFNVEGRPRTSNVNNSQQIDAIGNPDALKRKPSKN